MKKITTATLGMLLALGSILPVIAQTQPEKSTGQPLTGQVSSTEKSEVTVQFPENKTQQTYRLEPGLVTSMNLSQGSTVSFDSRKLGTIINVDRDSVVVEFADGETEPYFLHQEGRATLTFGDRIVVTPDLRLARAENYVLTAADIDSTSMSASNTVTPDPVNQPMPSTEMPTTSPTAPAQPATPVTPAPNTMPAPASPTTPTTPTTPNPTP
jgi:hypothetical protein